MKGINRRKSFLLLTKLTRDHFFARIYLLLETKKCNNFYAFVIKMKSENNTYKMQCFNQFEGNEKMKMPFQSLFCSNILESWVFHNE